MPNVLIDKEKCIKCNTCARLCVMGIIKPASEISFPRMQQANEERCMKCGHCEAFCPEKALVLDYKTEEKIYFDLDDSIIDAQKLSLYMKKRRSIRMFKQEPVDKSTIEKLIDAAHYAPTGGNSQTVQWTVIYNTKKVNKIAGLTVDWMRTIINTPHPLANYVDGIITAWEKGYDAICRNAPHLVYAHVPHSEFIADTTDAVIALSSFDIAAPAFGIGCCWAGFIQMGLMSYPPLREALEIPEKRNVGYVLFFGYPEITPVSIPRRESMLLTWA